MNILAKVGSLGTTTLWHAMTCSLAYICYHTSNENLYKHKEHLRHSILGNNIVQLNHLNLEMTTGRRAMPTFQSHVKENIIWKEKNTSKMSASLVTYVVHAMHLQIMGHDKCHLHEPIKTQPQNSLLSTQLCKRKQLKRN